MNKKLWTTKDHKHELVELVLGRIKDRVHKRIDDEQVPERWKDKDLKWYMLYLVQEHVPKPDGRTAEWRDFKNDIIRRKL